MLYLHRICMFSSRSGNGHCRSTVKTGNGDCRGIYALYRQRPLPQTVKTGNGHCRSMYALYRPRPLPQYLCAISARSIYALYRPRPLPQYLCALSATVGDLRTCAPQWATWASMELRHHIMLALFRLIWNYAYDPETIYVIIYIVFINFNQTNRTWIYLRVSSQASGGTALRRLWHKGTAWIGENLYSA